MTNNRYIDKNYLARRDNATRAPHITYDASKMLLYILIISFAVQIDCTSLCDSDTCVCTYENNANEDFHGKSIKCSYSEVNILDSGYALPESVYSLDLSSTNITVLKSNLFQSKSLVQLLLNKNGITQIVAHDLMLPELKRLDLSDNLLEYIDPETFRDINKLEYLNLAKNKFTTFAKLAFHHLSNLKEIILDHNNIGLHVVDTNLFDRSGFGLTSKIQNISIGGINLNKVPDNFFVDAYDLRKLIISDNNITEMFEIPYTLNYLDISDNPITAISPEDFEDLPGLMVLKLNNLQIDNIPEYAFASLKSLRELEVERNRNLVIFSSLAFGKDVLEDADDFALEKLSIKGSRLKTLDERLLEPFSQLIELDLQANPWQCDCNIVWLKKLQIPEHYNDYLRCAIPSPLYNARIFDLKARHFVCKQHHVGATVAIVAFASLLSAIAILIFVCLPRYTSRCKIIREMYAPSTAYSVLPMSASFHNDRD